MRARREEHLGTLTGLKTVRYRSYELRDMVCCYAMLCSALWVCVEMGVATKQRGDDALLQRSDDARATLGQRRMQLFLIHITHTFTQTQDGKLPHSRWGNIKAGLPADPPPLSLQTGAPDLSKPRPKARSSTAKGKKDASGLGRAIINRRAKEQKRLYEEALHTSELPSGLHSVTQENDLDEFLNTAQLAATDFTAGVCLTRAPTAVCSWLWRGVRRAALTQYRRAPPNTQSDRTSASSPHRASYSSRTRTCSASRRSKR